MIGVPLLDHGMLWLRAVVVLGWLVWLWRFR